MVNGKDVFPILPISFGKNLIFETHCMSNVFDEWKSQCFLFSIDQAMALTNKLQRTKCKIVLKRG